MEKVLKEVHEVSDIQPLSRTVLLHLKHCVLISVLQNVLAVCIGHLQVGSQ
jgi:hypothetical protein